MSGHKTMRYDSIPDAVQLLHDRPELRGVSDLTDALDQAGRWSA